MASTSEENYNPEELLLDTLNNLDIGYVKVSNDGTILNHNLTFNKIFGYDPEINLIDTKVLDYWLNSEERNKFREILYKNGIVKKFVTSAKKIDGKKIVLELTFKLNKNSNGEIISSEGTFIDVTEHIENEQKLKDSEEKYHLISENANDLISILNEKFEIEYFNENTYQKLLGYSKDEVIGNLSLNYIHPDDIEHATRLFKEIFKSGEAQGDIRVKNKFGRYFWLEAKGKTFIDKNGKKKFLMISRDITERKKAEEEIKSRYEFERLISLISIDFINILNENLNDLINLALKKIGQFINAVRCSIFIYSEDLTRVTNTNEWCIDPNDSQIALLQNIPSENFGYYLKLLKEKKNVIINRFDDIPLEASGEREWIQEYGFRSLMFVPMVYKDKLFGTLGFYGEINVEREWVKDLIDLLKVLANIFVNSIVSKQSEELLYHERDLIRTLLDNHPDFIYFKDINARYQHISKNFSDYFKRGIEEIIGKTDLELFPREIANQPHSEDLNVIKTGIPLINKEETDGETWVLSTKMPWLGKDGNIKGLFGISRDITERKKTEQLLKESEEKFKNIAEQNLMGICILQDNVIKYINKAMAEIYGYTIEEILNWEPMEYFKLFTPESLEIVREQSIKKQKGDPDQIVQYIIHGVKRTGELIWVDNISRTINYEGRPADLITEIDITERTIIEEALNHERDLIHTLLDNHPDYIYFKDSNARYQHISKNFSDYFERGIEEIIGKTDLELFPREIANQPHSEDLQIIKTGIPLINKEDTDGETWILTTKMPWFEKDGSIKGSFGISRDITERKKIELKLKESELKYKAAYNKAEFYKDIFTHDINNILSNIQTSIELSAMYLKDPNRIPDVEELYEVIREQFKKSSSLVSTIRKLSQIDEAVSLVKPVELNDVLKKEIDFILNSYQTRNVNIRTQGFEQIISVNANDLLIDLFQNLLNNAIKYNDSQIVEIYIKMSKEKKNKNDYIKLEFSDNGIGISDKRKDTLFEKDYSKEISSKGLGIGLTLVKKIVESYKGEIWIEDRITGDYRQGANFIVLIPEAV